MDQMLTLRTRSPVRLRRNEPVATVAFMFFGITTTTTTTSPSGLAGRPLR